jgi:histidinol-phosphate aminotransferase
MHVSFLVSPSKGIVDMQAYVPGAAQAPGSMAPLRLASNEAALGTSAFAVRAMIAAAGEVDRYPDPECVKLRQALGAKYKQSPDQIVCGSGSEALIHIIMRCYLGPGDGFLAPEFAFSLGKIAAMSCGASIEVAKAKENLDIDVDALLAGATGNTKVVYLPNPNNPTGVMLGFSEIKRLREGLAPHILLVIDAAYRDYVNDPNYDPGDALVDRDSGNVIVLGTFSKSFGIAGARVGWLYTSLDIVSVISRVRPAFGVNSVAQAGAIAALEDSDHVDAEIALVQAQRVWLSQAVVDLGLKVTPTQGNFVLVHFPQGYGTATHANAFLTDRAILVRPVTNYGLANALRISVGTHEQMQRVVATLNDYLISEQASKGRQTVQTPAVA